MIFLLSVGDVDLSSPFELYVNLYVLNEVNVGAISCHEGRDSHSARFNHLSRWLWHSSIQATPIYLELVPNPAVSLAAAR